MRTGPLRSMIAMAAAIVVLSLAPVAAGQRGQNGPNLRALPEKHFDPPRTPDGQPDMQGEWSSGARVGSPSHSIEQGSEPDSVIIQGQSTRYIADSFATVIIDPPDGRIPYQPWAAAKRKQMLVNMFAPTKRGDIDPDDRCWVEGEPRANYLGGMQINQRPGYVVILYGWAHSYRIIPLDGRPHVGSNIKLQMADSRGHWEGDTLVVDVTNNSDKIWFDSHGSFHSDAMHLVERWTMVDANTIYYEATIEDPKVYTQPWKLAVTLDRNKDKKVELWEEACREGNGELVDGRYITDTLHMYRAAEAAGKKVTGIHQHDQKVIDFWLKKAAEEAAQKNKEKPVQKP